MGEQRRLAELCLARDGGDVAGDAGKFAEQQVFALQCQRDQRGARFDDFQSELAGKVIGEAGGAHLGDRRPASGDHQPWRGETAVLRLDRIVVAVVRNGRDLLPQRECAACALDLVHEHVDDLARRAVAEQLAQRLFVPCDAMRLDKVQKVARRVAAKRRFHEMRIGRKEAVGRGVDIGEIAPPAARYQDLGAGFRGFFDHQHAAAALARAHRAHHARRAATQYDGVIIVGHGV